MQSSLAKDANRVTAISALRFARYTAPMTDENTLHPHDPGQPHAIEGAGDVMLHARSWGPSDARPILFVHGWSASHLSWARQCNSPALRGHRLVAVDLRGHGFSARPQDPLAYQSGALWADDLAAVMRALSLHRPVVVAWSYGGYVLGDYLRHHGPGNIGAVNFVGAAALCGNPPRFIGPDFVATLRRAIDPDPWSMLEGLRAALDLTTHRRAAPPERERAIAAMSLADPRVRGWMMMRTLDCGPDYARLACPCLISQGENDRIVLPEMAAYIQSHIPHAERSGFPDCGHAPHLEATERFNQELATLVDAAK
jgi:pimeloyl-ACP methyl ester carboxylesterase